jgi:hypothetical protein
LNSIFAEGVTIDSIPKDKLKALSRHPLLGQGTVDFGMYIRKAPKISPDEFVLVRTYLQSEKVKATIEAPSFEGQAVKMNIKPEWDGSVCKVGDQIKQMVPVCHSQDEQMKYEADEWSATIASMMLSVTHTGEIKTEVTKELAGGPMALLMTETSVAAYNVLVPRLLSGRIETDRADEKVAENIYRAISQGDASLKNAMLEATYSLFEKMDVKTKAISGAMSVTTSKLVEVKWVGMRKDPLTKKITPVGRISKLLQPSVFIKKTPKVGRDASNVALQEFVHSFPPKLI